MNLMRAELATIGTCWRTVIISSVRLCLTRKRRSGQVRLFGWETTRNGLTTNHHIQTLNSKLSQMGWHTDSPRDIFSGQRIMPILNVGIHLNPTPYENGGLRVVPGTHKQDLLKMLFRKKSFVDNDPDKHEIGFDMSVGDSSVHDGRIRHRAQQSPFVGEASRRRVMYVPVVTG